MGGTVAIHLFFLGGGKRGKPPTDFQAAFFFVSRQASEGQSFLFGSALGEFVGKTWPGRRVGGFFAPEKWGKMNPFWRIVFKRGLYMKKMVEGLKNLDKSFLPTKKKYEDLYTVASDIINIFIDWICFKIVIARPGWRNWKQRHVQFTRDLTAGVGDRKPSEEVMGLHQKQQPYAGETGCLTIWNFWICQSAIFWGLEVAAQLLEGFLWSLILETWK